MNDLDVGQCRLATRTPVDEPLSAVKQAVVPKPNERFPHCQGKSFVHGKAFMRPIAGDSQRSQLMQNGTAGFLSPLPDSLYEFFPPHLGTAQPLRR
jgi:hypothetical protein